MDVVHDYQQHTQSAQDINAVQPEARRFLRLSANALHGSERIWWTLPRATIGSSLEVSRELGQPAEILRAVLHDHAGTIIRDQVLETID
jgi:hypothetical protein